MRAQHYRLLLSCYDTDKSASLALWGMGRDLKVTSIIKINTTGPHIMYVEATSEVIKFLRKQFNWIKSGETIDFDPIFKADQYLSSTLTSEKNIIDKF